MLSIELHEFNPSYPSDPDTLEVPLPKRKLDQVRSRKVAIKAPFSKNVH